MRTQVIPQRAEGIGTCPTCGTENQPLITARRLSDYFELLLTIYVPDQQGKHLVSWLSEDWALFRNPNISQAQAQVLIGEILNDGEIVRQNFGLSNKCRTDSLERWRALTEELKSVNRYFPDAHIDTDRLGLHLSNLILRRDEQPAEWYRARIEKDGVSFPLSEMGAPPPKLASSGRANPVGIPYLYLGSELSTAIAEVRPHPGERVCVATFVLEDNLKIVDLREPRTLVSPFLQEDEGNIALLRGDIDFLELLGNELAIPVVPEQASTGYIPSQYLCEFIKKCGFDGVAYGSSLSDGMNIALFRPEAAEGRVISEHKITGLNLSIEAIGAIRQ